MTQVMFRNQTLRYVGICLAVMIFIPACQTAAQGVDRVQQDEMECKLVVQAEWGDGPGELGYVPDDQSSHYVRRPYRFQVDDIGNIYVADLHNQRVVKFSPKGEFLQSFKVPISENEELVGDIAVRGDWIAVVTKSYFIVFDQKSGAHRVLEHPSNAGTCSMSMTGKAVHIDQEGNVYGCVWGGFERGGTIVQYDRQGQSREFFVGPYDHFVVGWDGFLYIQQLKYAESDETGLLDDGALKFDVQGNQVGQVVISGDNLAEADLLYAGLLVAVDADGNLYGTAVNKLKDGKVIPQEALVQIDPRGTISQIIERATFTASASDVWDQKGNLYLLSFGEVPAEPAKVWRCSP